MTLELKNMRTKPEIKLMTTKKVNVARQKRLKKKQNEQVNDESRMNIYISRLKPVFVIFLAIFLMLRSQKKKKKYSQIFLSVYFFLY